MLQQIPGGDEDERNAERDAEMAEDERARQVEEAAADEEGEGGADEDGEGGAAATNNRQANYTPGENMRILDTIKEVGMHKPPSADSVWRTMSKTLNRPKKVLCKHWSLMLGFIKFARSNLKKTHPKLDTENTTHASSGPNSFEGKCETYYRDLLSYMHANKNTCGAKTWWDLTVVTALCDFVMEFEDSQGLNRVQTAKTLGEIQENMDNKFAAEAEGKKKLFQDRAAAELLEKQEQKDFKKGILASLSTFGASFAQMSSPAVSSVGSDAASTAATAVLTARVDGLDSKMDRILGLMTTLVGQKRGHDDSASQL
jgi:hypothetical protein